MDALAKRLESYRALAITTNDTYLVISFGFKFFLQVCIANAVITDKSQIFFYFCHRVRVPELKETYGLQDNN